MDPAGIEATGRRAVLIQHGAPCLSCPHSENRPTGPKDAVCINKDVCFTITVKNTGNGTATNVVLVDNLPAGLTRLSACSAQERGDATNAIADSQHNIGDPASAAAIGGR